MIHSLKVAKGIHPVQLTYDGEGLRIEGDLNAHKKGKVKPGKKHLPLQVTDAHYLLLGKPRTTLGCIPLPPAKTADPTLLPFDNVFLLQVGYNDKTHMIHISTLVPTQPGQQDQSSVDLFKFMYTVDKGQEQECLDFCKTVMTGAYKGKQKKKSKVTND
jgi:sphingosine kinase